MSLPDSQQAAIRAEEGVTRKLAHYLVASQPGDLPEKFLQLERRLYYFFFYKF